MTIYVLKDTGGPNDGFVFDSYYAAAFWWANGWKVVRVTAHQGLLGRMLYKWRGRHHYLPMGTQLRGGTHENLHRNRIR